MMNTQTTNSSRQPAAGVLQTVRAGRIVPLGSAGGRLEVLHGRVWLTRSGELDDHVVESGQSLSVPPSGRVLLEGWDDESPALIAWQPGTTLDRVGAALHTAFGRCWNIVDPARRVGSGSLAAAVALISGALLFGPLSDARTRELAARPVLHNGVQTSSRVTPDAQATKGSPSHVGAGHRERARIVAQEAGRHEAGTA
jgi:Protein of unknown function (DUF2917)